MNKPFLPDLRMFLLWGCLSAIGQAATVVIDFNDANTGQLSGQSAFGVGTTGNWGGSSEIDVVSGDLTAAASTNYNITQSGTAQSAQGTDFGSNSRKANVAFSTALTGSTIWGSFLVNLNGDTDGRGGIQFNTSSISDPSAQDPRIFALGNSAEGWTDGNSGEEVLAGTLTASDTSLFLFRIDFQAAGNDTLTMWLDPDVTNLGAGVSDADVDWLGTSGITNISVFSYNGAGPIVDNIRLSDEADAFFQVTGVPEPSTFLLMGVAGLTLLVLRRRR